MGDLVLIVFQLRNLFMSVVDFMGDLLDLLIDVLDSLFEDFLHLHDVVEKFLKFLLSALSLVQIEILILEIFKCHFMLITMNINLSLWTSFIFNRDRFRRHSSSIRIQFRLLKPSLRRYRQRELNGLLGSVINAI